MKKIAAILVDELEQYGEAYLGTIEVQGEKVIKLFTAIQKEVTKRHPRNVACWNTKEGNIWMVRV